MDATPPAIPEPEPAPAPEPRPLRLWRGVPQGAEGCARRRQRLIPALLVLAGVVGLGGVLLTWFQPAPTLEFVPLWAIGSTLRPLRLPALAEGEPDRSAFTTPGRNPLADAWGDRGQPPDSIDLAAALDARTRDAVRVVYLAARAATDAQGVRLLLDDTYVFNDRRAGWRPLREVLDRLSQRPAGAGPVLLILDLRRVRVDPRFGLEPIDLGSAVRDELARFQAFPGLVLASCGPGEEPLTSEALGRSAFSVYVEEGLRGWADTSPRDGRVMARELAAWVSQHVARWAERARGRRQSPALIADGGGDDFPLAVLPRARRGPHLALPDPKTMPSYPAWLRDGWAERDALRTAQADRDDPRHLASVEALLRTAELDWRGGGDATRLRRILTEALADLRRRRDQDAPTDRPRPLSLARDEAQNPPRAADKTLRSLLIAGLPTASASTESGSDAKTAEADTARAIAAFYATPEAAKATDAALARAVFRLACEPREPARATLSYLDRLLRTRQPRPLYAETDALRRLAALPARDWRPSTVRLALTVASRGEQAASHPAALGWVRPLLDAAEAARHDGEVLLDARGYAPIAEADRRLRLADVAIGEALAAIEAVETARDRVNEALDRLPVALDHLDDAPAREAAWFEAARQARATIEALGRPPATDRAETREQIAAIEARAEALGQALAALQAPFAAARIARLTVADAPASPERYAALSDLLEAPWPTAPQRAAVWSALVAVDRRLNEEVRRLDASDAALTTPTPRPDEAAARARRQRQARGLAALQTLGGPAESDPAGADRRGRLVPAIVPTPDLDDSETNPTRRLREAEFRAFRAWTASRFARRANDLGGSPFEAAAALEYGSEADEPAPAAIVAFTNGSEPRLDPSEPLTMVPALFRSRGGVDSTTAKIEIVTADPDWLEIRRWPAEASNPSDAGPPRFDLTVAKADMAAQTLEVRLRPEGESEHRGPVPLGFLIRSRVGLWSTYAPVRLRIVPESQRLRITLGTDPSRPGEPLDALRLRPVKNLPGHYVHVQNPTETDRNVLVQLLDGPVLVPGCEVPLTLKARSPARVSFGPPAAKPEADLVEVRGPLRVRVLDAAEPSKVLAEAGWTLAVAQPRDLLRVVSARFDPAGPGNEGKARLAVRLRAVGPIVGPPCVVEMVLDPDRIPGLLDPGEGTLRAELAAEGDEAVLVAVGPRLDERDEESGFVDLTVDGVPRALIFRATLPRQGEPVELRLDDRPAIRLKAPRSALSVSPFDVGLMIDNAPAGSRVEALLGQVAEGRFRIDARREPAADRDRITLNPRGAGDALRFEASERDPVISFDVRQIRGRRELRARLIDPDGTTLDDDDLSIVFDDRAPDRARLVDVPGFAKAGDSVELHAVASAGGVAVQKVLMFVGRPVEGKTPPNASVVEARATDVSRTSWVARLPVPADRKGSMDVSVQVVNLVGQSRFDTATLQVVEELPIEPGVVRGQVVEGPRPQAGLDVVVFDGKGVEKGRATSDRSGRFVVKGLPPGPYRVICVKPTPPTKGLAEAVVVPGKPVEVTVEMLRTR